MCALDQEDDHHQHHGGSCLLPMSLPLAQGDSNNCSDDEEFVSHRHRQWKSSCKSRLEMTRRAVCFGVVEVIEFLVTIGVNPAVREGCPIMLGEEHRRRRPRSLDAFERLRRGKRRNTRELYLSKEHREEILLYEGFSRREIIAGVRAARKERQHRQISYDRRHWDSVDEKLEESKMKLKKIRLFKGGSSKKAREEDVERSVEESPTVHTTTSTHSSISIPSCGSKTMLASQSPFDDDNNNKSREASPPQLPSKFMSPRKPQQKKVDGIPRMPSHLRSPRSSPIKSSLSNIPPVPILLTQ